MRTSGSIALLAALALAGTAQAQWTPTRPGDPRTCSMNKPAECGGYAAELAFKAKYLRVVGRSFGDTLDCAPAGSLLAYMCAWGTSGHTPVRFTHKATGWKVAVGVIPVATG